jgi:cell division protein FtsI/penicillin-binding protein 2
LDPIAKTTSTKLALLLLFLAQTSSCIPQEDLHSQATAALLETKFSDPDISFLALDGAGQILAQRWPDSEEPVPIGSLIKPFLALAFGRTHDTYPEYECMGKKTCWLERGHGRLGIREAIGFSCNSYFHQLVAAAGSGFAQPTLTSYGLTDTSLDTTNFLADSRVAPMTLARAFLQLARNRQQPAADVVLQGMAISARRGTAKAIGDQLPRISALAKTGTAPCTHPKKAPGDGFAVVIAPSDRPHLVLLVRLHGRPGSMAAALAARMVAAVENGQTPR